MQLRTRPGAAALVAIAATLGGCGSSPDAGQRRLGDDVFATGSHVQLLQATPGDAVVFGRRVELEAPVAGDAIVAGGDVSIASNVSGDVYAAGANVLLDAAVDGNARLAGRNVHLSPRAELGGGASIAGRDVRIEGTLADYLTLAAEHAQIDARVRGDVEVTGDSLVLGPSAFVAGRLTFRGPEPPQLSPGARVMGELLHVDTPAAGAGSTRWLPVFATLLWALGAAVVGAVALRLWPGFTQAATAEVSEHTGRSALAGLALVVLVPLLAALLLASIIGIPLGLLVLCAYVLVLQLGYVTSALALSEALLARFWRRGATSWGARVSWLAGTLVALGLLTHVPVLGALLASALVLCGAGALTRLARNRYRSGGGLEPTPAAPIGSSGPISQGA